MTVQGTEPTSSEPSLAQAVRDHVRLLVIATGHVAPHGAVHVTDHAVMSSVGSPSLFNRATALSLAQPDVALGEVERFFDGLPHSLWLHDDDVTEESRALLAARGYVPLPTQHGMALSPLPRAGSDAGDSAHADLLTDPSAAAEIADVAASGYGTGVDDRLFLEDLARAVLRHARPWDHGAIYGVREGGTLVSTGVLLCTKDVAGITGLATIPRSRHQHHASSIATRALADAAALGLEVAVTLATPDSEPAMRRLGFRTLVDYHVYRQARA
ncbi:MAG: hypothetical protein KY461_11715 [Actinobacteria bacterium]|nr:hypothetical protein [Actinomycetota bacterium]